MRQFPLKINKFLRIALGMLIVALLFVIGKSGGSDEFTLATGAAAIVLTEEEKAGLSEPEQKMFLAVKKLTEQAKADARAGLMTKEDVQSLLGDLKNGLTATEIKALKDEIEKLEGIVKQQGTTITQLKEKGGNSYDDSLSFIKAWEDNIDRIKEIRSAEQGNLKIFFGDYVPKDKKQKDNSILGVKSLFGTKVAGITSIANSTASDPAAITNPYSVFPVHTGEVVGVRRNPNVALNIVDVGSTNSANIVWTEEGNSEGDAEVTAEGATKPLQDKKFIDRQSKAIKLTGRIVITEEMEDDAPRVATAVRRLFEENVMRKWDDKIYADVVAAAPGYTLTSLDDQVDNADDFAAIAAGMCQIEANNGNADTLVLNPADKWKMRLIKGTDGHYVTPPFQVGNNTYDGVRVVISNKVAAGNFLLGEGRTYKVEVYKPFNLRVGFSTGDFEKNQFSIVGEVRFHSYIPTNNKPAWIYASFATVKAAIEKP